MSTIEIFQYEDAGVRVTIDAYGDPWFVLSDLCRILDIRNGRDVAARLADDQKGVDLIDTPGGRQQMTLVNEAGMYEVVIRSDKPEAVKFRRWVTGDVLPSIRRTGSYSVAPALEGPELLARAVLEAQAMLAAKDERIAELEPKAEVADKILNAEGDLAVADVAKALTRAGIKTGENRLFTFLNREMEWTYRGGDGRWRVKQTAIEAGCMSVLPQSHYHPRTGILTCDAPQPRITPKGMQKLLQKLDPGGNSGQGELPL